MTYFPQNPNGQNTNNNSAPVTISSDQISNNTLASDESLVLLRRLVKLAESNAVVDVANRQRIVVDGITTGAIATVNNIVALANMDHKQFIDISRLAYANCIRSKLNFS